MYVALADFLGSVFFDVPLEVVAQVNADLHAQVIFGAMANWTLGDHYITWDPKDHWQHVNPTKSESYASVFSAEADFDASADFSLTPTLNMHVDHIYTYRLSFKPDLHMELQGSTQTKQICADASYDMQVTAESEISINSRTLISTLKPNRSAQYPSSTWLMTGHGASRSGRSLVPLPTSVRHSLIQRMKSEHIIFVYYKGDQRLTKTAQ